MNSQFTLKLALGFANRHRVFIGLLCICAVFGARNPAFLSFQNLYNILLQSTPIALVSAGMTFVILRGGIDLSVGSVVALSGLVFGYADLRGFPLPISMAAAALTGLACGCISGAFVALAGVPAFIATLGMMSATRGIALALTDGRSLSGFSNSLLAIANTVTSFLPISLVVLASVFLIGHLILEYMVPGRHLHAVGSNPKTAYLCGINVRFYTVLVYAISGFCAALASIVLTSRLNSAHPLAGSLYELDAIAAVVIGGGSIQGGQAKIFGTLLGALVLATLKNGLSILNVSSYAQQVIVGSILITTAVIDTIGNKKEEN